MDSYLTDVEALLTHMKHADKQIKLKRRLLMGLSTSKYEGENEFDLFQTSCLPEVLLREDDVFYETSKTFVEKAFGIVNRESDYHTFQKIMQDSDIPCISKKLSSRLDNISNTGLYLLATHLTGGHISQNKTRRILKKVIQGCMQRMQKCEGKLHSKGCAQLYQVVSDPCFFRKGGTSSFDSSYRSSFDKVQLVLSNLKDFPTEVLLSIHRKLKGESGKMLHLGIQRSGWNRDRLIDHVKRVCKSRLAELEKGDELPHPIAKAMAVTTLSMKLTPGIQNPNLADFYQFPPDIVALQNSIAKAIWLINEKVRVSELRELQMLLGVSTDIPIKGLRSAIRKLLTIYLFECDDMDDIPKSLLASLSLINRSSRKVPLRYFPKEEIDEDVECLLGVGAQVKQVMLDSLPDHNYEQEFTDAYMEDLQESESDESDTDYALSLGSDSLPNNISFMNDSAEPAESVGDSLFTEKDISDVDPAILCSNTSTNTEIVADLTGDTSGHLLSDLEPTNTGFIGIDEEQDPSEQGGSSNKYLRVQDTCDETSLFAYKCIGHLLKEFARLQGLNVDPDGISYLTGGHSITDHKPDATEKQALGDDLGGKFICQVVEELYPSRSNSVKAKLEELMSLI